MSERPRLLPPASPSFNSNSSSPRPTSPTTCQSPTLSRTSSRQSDSSRRSKRKAVPSYIEDAVGQPQPQQPQQPQSQQQLAQVAQPSQHDKEKNEEDEEEKEKLTTTVPTAVIEPDTAAEVTHPQVNSETNLNGHGMGSLGPETLNPGIEQDPESLSFPPPVPSKPSSPIVLQNPSPIRLPPNSSTQPELLERAARSSPSSITSPTPLHTMQHTSLGNSASPPPPISALETELSTTNKKPTIFGTAPPRQGTYIIGKDRPREILRIERDYTGGDQVCQFFDGWIWELEGRITPTQFQKTMNELNRHLASANDPRRNMVDNVLAILTLYVSSFLKTGHYRKEMKFFYQAIETANESLFNPVGLNILDPRKNALLILEIEYY